MCKQPWRSLVTLVAAVPLLGCSLMGLDDFGVKPCQTDADCAKAGPQLQPGPSACGAAVCEKQKGLCEWAEGRESCDGNDNDCNGLIDDGLAFLAPSSALSGAVLAAVAYAFEPASRLTYVAVALDGGASQGFMLPGDAAPTELQYDSARGPGCPKLAVNDTAVCNFAELALAADASHLLFASINTYGCAAGQLRVGLSDRELDPFAVWLGKADQDQSQDQDYIAFGVDVNTQGCTGASLVAPGALALGATRPAVASLGTEANGEGALVLWLAAAANNSDAPARTNINDSIGVEALGLVVPTAPPEWLNGTDRGIPTELGPTTSLSAPAVLPLKKSPSEPGSYLVAFPAEQAGEPGIQLFRVQVLKSSLLFRKKLDFLSVGPADQVSLALGNIDHGEVGLAWRSSNSDDAQLCFTIVSSSGTWPAPQTVLKVPKSDPITAAQILYEGTGFANHDPTGGWFLSWVESAATDSLVSELARVRDRTLQVLTQRTLGAGVTARTLLYPSSSEGVSSIGYAMITPAPADQTTLETNFDWCH